MNNKRMYNVYDIEKLLDIKKTKAYEVIKDLNNELEAMGSKVINGKIPAVYFHNRYLGFKESEVKECKCNCSNK